MEMVKTFRVFAQNKHEYDITVEETERGVLYSLAYSNLPEWSFPGDLIFSILDDGGDLHISKKLGKKIDYAEMIELKMLFNFIASKDGKLAEKYEAIEVPQKPLVL
jgi:hypothetical protein